MEKKQTELSGGERQLLAKLRTAPEYYTLLSRCTNAPYVICDGETFDDEVLLFLRQEDGKREAERLLGEKRPVSLAKVEKRQLLAFLGSLLSMGVNALLVNDGKETVRIQLDRLVKRDTEALPADGGVWVENPALHLTALFFVQELRRPPEVRDVQRLKELQEELEADVQKATLLTPLPAEGAQLPLVKLADGELYQPFFTDMPEFRKFNREQHYRPAAVPAEKLPLVAVKEAKGIVLNPMEVRLSLQIQKTGGKGTEK